MSSQPNARTLDLSTAPVPVRIWEGEGRDVLLVHGALVDGRLWDAVAPLLAAQGLRVVVPDLPLGAHRLPARPGAQLSVQTIAALLGEVVAELGLDDVVLVGNDSGGAIAQVAAAARPAWLGALVLTPADILENFPPSVFKALPVLARRAPWALVAGLQPLRSRALRRTPLLLGWLTKRGVSDELSDAWMRPFFDQPAIRRDFLRLAATIDPADTVAAARALRDLDRPVIVAWAPDDRFFTREYAERLVAGIPGARLERIEDSYAFSPIDQPARTAELILGVGTAAGTSGPDAGVALGA